MKVPAHWLIFPCQILALRKLDPTDVTIIAPQLEGVNGREFTLNLRGGVQVTALEVIGEETGTNNTVLIADSDADKVIAACQKRDIFELNKNLQYRGYVDAMLNFWDEPERLDWDAIFQAAHGRSFLDDGKQGVIALGDDPTVFTIQSIDMLNGYKFSGFAQTKDDGFCWANNNVHGIFSMKEVKPVYFDLDFMVGWINTTNKDSTLDAINEGEGDVVVDDYYGGNIDDAFNGGVESGEIQKARDILHASVLALK